MFNITRIVRTMAAAVVMALFCQLALAQTRVSGTVVDETGAPLAGASVIEVGTTNGTITDVDGAFVLTAKEGATLSVSFIGFLSVNATVPADGKLTVTLAEDKNLLNEVVVVGYGTMARKDVTSSITTLRSDDLDKGVFTDAGSMLQGKVAGLVITQNADPNGGPSMTLRGASSLRSGAMSPYYVVDGIPGVDIAMVAPDDIESIDVLRDATATAIYGSKAANGVILITTKKGKSDRVNVSYNGYVAADIIAKNLDMASADDIRKYVADNGVSYSYDAGANTNWRKEAIRTAVSHNHNVSINGGGSKTRYMASANYVDRQGVVKGTNMNRVNLRSLVSTKFFKDHVELSLGVNGMIGKNVGVATGKDGDSVLDAINYFNPTNPVRGEDGKWFYAGSKNYNPLALINEDRSETQHKKLQAIAKATINIIDGLSWNFNYQYGCNQLTYSQYNTHDSQIFTAQQGNARRSTYFGTENTFETYGNYDKTFNEKHKLGIMAGYSWEQRTYNDGFGVNVHHFYNDDLQWYNLNYASRIDGLTGVESGARETVRNISFYGRINYAYDSRYSFQLTVRGDGSSVFGKNNRWGAFPSGSFAWNISEESFMKDQNVVSNLKLRAGYGVSGNAMGFGAYTAVPTFGTGAFFDYNGEQWKTLISTKNANPDLKWETTGMFNIGLDFEFLHGRLGGTIEYYNKKTNDLIWSYPVSTTIYPYGWIDANVGAITNNGVELSINAIPVQTKDFTWNTTLNFAHNSNRVDRLSNEKFEVGLFWQGDPNVAGVAAGGHTQRIIEGKPLGTFFTYQFAGYDEAGLPTYYTRDADTGEVNGTTNDVSSLDTKDRAITGCAQPKLTMGWHNTFTYKGFSASLFFTGMFGNDIYNATRAQYTSPQMWSDGKNVLKEFLTVRPKTDLAPNIPSDRWIEKGDYFRLQTLTLGYTFTQFNEWIKSLQIYFTCNNVFTITGYKGLDPEVNLGGIEPGIDCRWNNYPHTRTFLFGAKINF